MRWLVDEVYADARIIHLVVDNLNTHTSAAFYEAFPPSETHRLARRVCFHYTPQNGSWLNMAGIELSVMSTQIMADRMPDKASVAHEITAWETERNQAQATINWRFTTQDARIKLKRLFPSFGRLTRP